MKHNTNTQTHKHTCTQTYTKSTFVCIIKLVKHWKTTRTTTKNVRFTLDRWPVVALRDRVNACETHHWRDWYYALFRSKNKNERENSYWHQRRNKHARKIKTSRVISTHAALRSASETSRWHSPTWNKNMKMIKRREMNENSFFLRIFLESRKIKKKNKNEKRKIYYLTSSKRIWIS